jgi:plastocyanin
VLATIPVGNAPRKIVVQPGHAAKDAAVAPADVQAQAPPVPASAPGAAVSTAPAMADGSGAVRIQNFAFTPAPITVTPGTTVVWTNEDTIPHTSTAKEKQWDSGPIQPGASFTVTFDKAGTYTYACTIHPFMQAKVIVKPCALMGAA